MEHFGPTPVDILVENIDVMLDRFINHFTHNIKVKTPDAYNVLYRAKRQLDEIKVKYTDLKQQNLDDSDQIQQLQMQFNAFESRAVRAKQLVVNLIAEKNDLQRN